MGGKVLEDMGYARVVELSASVHTGWGSVSLTQLVVHFRSDGIDFCQVDTSSQEGPHVVRLLLTPDEMADAIQAYQSFLHDREASRPGERDVLDVDDHPF
ncbi:MAG: hypothetical protein ACR2H5_08175 [Ktedonobacteraceae bacterium]